jgi:DNA-binding ferritin-like protein (Dps family)
MQNNITLTEETAYEAISTLMRAAGRLSDIQEVHGENLDEFTNNLLNDAKASIFDAISTIYPR